jgi:SAM-dependent methyltransferase
VKNIADPVIAALLNYIDESPSTRNPLFILGSVRRNGFDYVNKLFNNKYYDRDFYSCHFRCKPAYENLATIVYEWAKPSTACDLGCGSGWLIYFLRKLGVAVFGYDNSSAILDFIDPTLKNSVSILDLSVPQSLTKCDLCVSIEMAEHTPKRCSNAVIDNITSCAKSHIFFTAAHPGQQGPGHVNCQKQKYWIDLFSERGWGYQSEATNCLQQRVKEDSEISTSLPWVAENVMLFRPISPK